jgi:hypothetical protein
MKDEHNMKQKKEYIHMGMKTNKTRETTETRITDKRKKQRKIR